MTESAYIHIPFCSQICNYCDFNKVFIHRQPVDEYLESLRKEMETTITTIPTSGLKTIYIGGGTPTSLNERQVEVMLKSIREVLPFSEGYEFTMEANPDDVSEEKLRVMKEYGVNRISYGVQTFDAGLLERLGRTHTEAHVFKTIDMTQRLGFDNVNIDLMYGLPEQTMEQVILTLQKAFTLGIQHISAYSLIVEPKTIFYNEMNKGSLRLPKQDDEATMYEYIMEEMEKNNLYQYEISNFANPGHESRHNLTYWNNEEYYGFGAGAHGYVSGERISNIAPINRYIDTVNNEGRAILQTHQVTERESVEEEMFLGLRKFKGVSIDTFQQKFKKSMYDVFGDEIKELLELELIEIKDNAVCLTEKGRLLGNEVFEKFI